MNRNDHYLGHHHHRPPARKVSSSSSSSCGEEERSGGDRLAPLRRQSQSSSPPASAHSSPVGGSPVTSPRMAPRLSPMANLVSAGGRRMLQRKTSSGLRDELGILLGELSVSSSSSPPRSPSTIGSVAAAENFAVAGRHAEAQTIQQVQQQQQGAAPKTVTPENSMPEEQDSMALEHEASSPPQQQASNGGGGGARSPPSSKAEIIRREKFLLFVRILFKCLDAHPSVSPSLRVEAKRVVRECTAKNRAGVEGYTPLVDALETRLRELDGMGGHWERAEGYARQFLVMRGRKMMAARRAHGVTKKPVPAATPPAVVVSLSPDGVVVDGSGSSRTGSSPSEV